MIVYGLDIGGSKLELSIFDAELTLLKRWRLPTPTSGYAEFLQTLKQQIHVADQFVEQAIFANDGAGAKLSCNKAPVGIALPGVQLESGMMVSSNVWYLNQKAVMLDLIRLLKRPVAVGNDCRLFALSEAQFGAGRHSQRVLGVVLGTGAGAGFCLGGRLLSGAQGLAGEFGHQSIAARVVAKYQLPLLQCGCGLEGCAENYISGAGLGRLYHHFGGVVACSHHWLVAFRGGQDAAVRAFECYLDALGAALAAQVLAYEPHVIVLGGGLSEISELTDAIPAALARHLFTGVAMPDIKLAEFGATSGGRGAAIAVLQHIHASAH